MRSLAYRHVQFWHAMKYWVLSGSCCVNRQAAMVGPCLSLASERWKWVRLSSLYFKIFCWLMWFLMNCTMASLSPTCSDQGRENRSSQFNGNQDAAAGGKRLQIFDLIKLCLLSQTIGPLRHLISIPRTYYSHQV